MFKSLEFDDCVVEGIRNAKLNQSEWQVELPLHLRSKVMAIVEATNWSELPQVAVATTRSLPTSDAILRGKSAFFAITCVAAILCGVVFGFLLESSLIVYLCSTFAIVSIGTVVFLQSRLKGHAAAFGIELTPAGTLTREDFLRYQLAIVGVFRAITIVGSISFLVLIIWSFNTVTQRIFGADDSVAAASIRLGTIFVIPLTIWCGWSSWRKGGAVFQFARCLRGFLACHLSPVWVSWLYKANSKLAKPETSEQPHSTISQVVLDSWPLPAIFLLFLVCLANTQWLEGMIVRRDAAYHARRGKAAWVNDVIIWMHEHPTSTLFLGATLASFSIAFFSHRLLTVVNPKFSGRFATAVFFMSILLFAAIA